MASGHGSLEPGDTGRILLPGDFNTAGRTDTPHPGRRMEPNKTVPQVLRVPSHYYKDSQKVEKRI